MTAAREQRRLTALHEYELLDMPAGDELEAVVRVAAQVAGVPFGTLNLIDENRQCQLTTTGFAGSDSARSDSMCAVRFETGQVTYLPDASLDLAYAFNPWVTGLLGKVRFYFSAPLVTPQGYALGSLCVFDEKRHELTDQQIDRLRDLAQVLLGLFECRRQARLNAELAAEVRQQHDELERAHAERAATIVELRRSNHELEQFAGVVSHDLAAPLTVVHGYLELLEEGVRGKDEQSEQWIGSAVRAVGRMHRLITSLLSYARAGHAPLRAERTDLGEITEQALTDLRAHLDGATVAVSPELPEVEADPTLLRQLLQNLLGNALKYRRPNRPCRVEVSATPDGDQWRVAVADNGVGIPPAQRERVFEMFAQVDPASGQGYGVGLSTCERIVDRHGGRIAATETPGGGTTVVFTLPARKLLPSRPS
ncbi:HAMP domain-containing histidine kinase [Actinoplanes sp. TRM 88003]|uniref:Sensor-like histidine kinase SenX3 n=1 Tax=Paractinoplanes aksuensis TaxID=2939490 RepID=A0ABT1DMK9_9ACTN|nr:HAMP domain-containing sensor histidine kinase [Actinoplanes aksuensis]MCO8271285.1 HAMP domain-containing histidine kinase [Actinoplanes aksuensis]